MIKRIAITGPESTGKSQLTAELAAYYNTVWTPEYAREYLEINGPYYQLHDIENIAKGQLESEENMMQQAKEWLFCDTEFIVLKIWCEHSFHKCPAWILKQIELQSYDLYLLPNIDLPWEPDPLREHPDMREYFFELYNKELQSRGLPFAIINGKGPLRLKNAIKAIEQRFSNIH